MGQIVIFPRPREGLGERDMENNIPHIGQGDDLLDGAPRCPSTPSGQH